MIGVPSSDAKVSSLVSRFQRTRDFSRQLCEPLEIEDFVAQSMPDASPIRWHLAHTTWFFETFILKPLVPGYEPLEPAYEYLFNSYYNTVGEQFPRPKRGLVTRPTVAEVFAYRRHVDQHIAGLFEEVDADKWGEVIGLIELGLNHEQQHQELMVTDLLHLFWQNPMLPRYLPDSLGPAKESSSLSWTTFFGGILEIGTTAEGFSYDNEGPRHEALLQPFQIADRLVTNEEYQAFIDDGGYRRAEFWLSQGWAWVQQNQVGQPLYWQTDSEGKTEFTAHGAAPLEDSRPVTHISFFEADAYARWADARLPLEAEWEVVASELPIVGNFAENMTLHPESPTSCDGLTQFFGDCWEWTASPYRPYPGYQPPVGAIGEYNGKFMCNQFVLRGGSCATSQSHIRSTYRNFFPPEAQWQFSGIRLAKDA